MSLRAQQSRRWGEDEILLSLVLLKERHLDRPFPDMPYAGVFALLPCLLSPSLRSGRGRKRIFPSPRPPPKASGRGEGQGRGGVEPPAGTKRVALKERSSIMDAVCRRFPMSYLEQEIRSQPEVLARLLEERGTAERVAEAIRQREPRFAVLAAWGEFRQRGALRAISAGRGERVAGGSGNPLPLYPLPPAPAPARRAGHRRLSIRAIAGHPRRGGRRPATGRSDPGGDQRS